MTIDGSLTTECIKEINNLGSSTFKNICDGTSHIVNWGVMSWLAAIGVFLLAVVMIGLIVAAIMMIRDV